MHSPSVRDEGCCPHVRTNEFAPFSSNKVELKEMCKKSGKKYINEIKKTERSKGTMGNVMTKNRVNGEPQQ